MINSIQSAWQAYPMRKGRNFVSYLHCSILCYALSGCIPPLFYFSSTDNTIQHSVAHSLQLALAYLEAGDTLKAKEKLLKAEKKNPHSIHVKGTMAYFLEKINEWEEAERYYLRALKKDREDGALNNNYGCFLCQRGRYKEAEKHFLEAAQNLKYINTDKAYENAGLCAMRHNDTEKAIKYFKIAIQHNPQLRKALLGLAVLYQSQQPEQAYEYLKRYRSLSP